MLYKKRLKHLQIKCCIENVILRVSVTHFSKQKIMWDSLEVMKISHNSQVDLEPMLVKWMDKKKFRSG